MFLHRKGVSDRGTLEIGVICCFSSQLLFLNIFDSQTLTFFGGSLVMVLTV